MTKDNEIWECESCGFLCLALHNCVKAPHTTFDMYDGIIYCYECANKKGLLEE